MGFRYVRALTGAAILLLVPLCGIAHEIGTTQVNATFQQDGTYIIDVITAPQATLNKLERLAALPRSRDLDSAEIKKRLSLLSPLLLEACEVQFDGKRVTPRLVVDTVSPASDVMRPSSARIRLSGNVPHAARLFRWRFALAYGSYSFSVQSGRERVPVRVWLDAGEMSAPFPVAAEVVPAVTRDVVAQYVYLGFTHILPKGLDHILFVLGMFLLASRVRDVLAQVTAFTVAHSITLALTMFGWMSVSPRIVEPAIALSIAYIAVENVLSSTVKPRRLVIIFCFGLLHGLGFAGVLRDLGLPPQQLVAALISFNAGVELGQLAVIAIAFVSFTYWWQHRAWYRRRFVVPASLVIGAIGVFWTIDRIA